jgi:hypothetical protein
LAGGGLELAGDRTIHQNVGQAIRFWRLKPPSFRRGSRFGAGAVVAMAATYVPVTSGTEMPPRWNPLQHGVDADHHLRFLDKSSRHFNPHLYRDRFVLEVGGVFPSDG